MHKFVAAKAMLGLATAAGLTVLGLAMAPAAAADETGPDTVACVQASAGVRAAAEKANDKADEIQAGQDQVIADLKAKVEAAQAAYDKAYAAYQADDSDENLAALQDAQAALDKALAALADAPGVPSDQKAALAKLQADLKAAIAVAKKACDFPDIVTTTVAPPTVTVTPAPTTSPRLPSAIDTGLA